MPDAQALDTLTFTEVDGRTTRRRCWRSTATRRSATPHIDSGMEAGMQEAMDRLEQVAVSLPVEAALEEAISSPTTASCSALAA